VEKAVAIAMSGLVMVRTHRKLQGVLLLSIVFRFKPKRLAGNFAEL
jgi:hypothetical protein